MMLRYDITLYFSMALIFITGSYTIEICKDSWPKCHETLSLDKTVCKSTNFSQKCQKSCGVCSDDLRRLLMTGYEDKCSCPCSDETPHFVNLTKSMMMENIRRMEQVMTVDKTKLSSYRRTKISTSDDRKSAKSIGQLGAVILIVIFLGIVLLDLCPRHTESNKVDVLKPKKKELCV